MTRHPAARLETTQLENELHHDGLTAKQRRIQARIQQRRRTQQSTTHAKDHHDPHR